MQTFEPWNYPVDLVLSQHQQLVETVENMIHACNTNGIKDNEFIAPKKDFEFNLSFLKQEIESHNEATKHIAGHILHSLKRISQIISFFVTEFEQSHQSEIQCSNATELICSLLENSGFKEKDWELTTFPYLKQLILQTILTLTKITTKKLPLEAIVILSKRLYLIEKVRHNNRKIGPKQTQREQICIAPWTVTKNNWPKAANFIKLTSKQIREKKTKELLADVIQPSMCQNAQKSCVPLKFDIRIDHKDLFLCEAQPVQVEATRDYSCKLWNASKILHFFYAPESV